MDCGIFRALFKKHNIHDKPIDITSGKPESSTDHISNSRRYHSHPNIAYVLPNDNRENDRIHQQHWLLKTFFGSNFSAPIEDDLVKGILVQDAGCGPGTWTLEMAHDYPRSTFCGTDVSTRFPEAIKPANCEFQVHNLVDEGFFPENHFNFIHQRLLFLGILKKDWEKVIREHVRTLAPGGWLECTEVPFDRQANTGPKSVFFTNAMLAVCNSRGLFGDVASHLKEMFANAGLVNIETKEIMYSVNPADDLGKHSWEDSKEALLGLKPFLQKTHPELEGDDNFAQFVDSLREEMIQNDVQQGGYRIWGQKPTLPRESEAA